MKLMQKILVSSVLGLMSSTLFANGLVLNNNELRQDLNWLQQQGVIQISTSTWPLSHNEIERALNQAKVSTAIQTEVIARVRQALINENQMLKASATIQSDSTHLPHQFGDNNYAQHSLSLEANVGGEYWDAKLRVNAEKDSEIGQDKNDVNVEGSYIAGKAFNQWLVAGQIPTWWGAGHDGSLIRGDASRPVTGFTLQRDEQKAFETKWLSWIGDWQYQIFAGQLRDYTAVPDAKLIGMRVTAQPKPYIELGFSRTLQWGGEGRRESFSDLMEALAGNKDNVYVSQGQYDQSNQIAGFDGRLSLGHLINVPVSIYAQYVGEDESNFLPTKKMYLAGLDYSSAYKKMPYQVYAEWADTRTNLETRGISYEHGTTYRDGFYQQGYPLAYPLGGDAQAVSVGGHVHVDKVNSLSGRMMFAKLDKANVNSRQNNYAFPDQDKLKFVEMAWTHRITPEVPLKVNAWLSDSDVHGQDGGVGVNVELPLDKKTFGLK